MNEKKQTMILLTTLFLMVSMLILYPVLKISLNNNNEDKIKNNVINIISEVNNYYKEKEKSMYSKGILVIIIIGK